MFAVVNAQAAIANPAIVALCSLVLALAWRPMITGERWALWMIGATLVPLQGFGFVADAFIGHRNLIVNLVSVAVLSAGLSLSALGLHRRVG